MRGRSVIETPRLILREMDPADLEAVAEMLGHPEVMRFWPRCYTRDEAQSWIRRQQDRYRQDGHGYWLAVEKGTGRPIGQAGVVKHTIDGADALGLGYIVHRPFWRQGFGAEAAAGCRDHVLETLGRPRVVSLVRPENLPSQALAWKIGLRPAGRTVHGGLEHLIFALWRAEGAAAESLS